MGKVIGIDLGTTNSAVAFIENGEPTIITNAQGGRTTPSVIAFTKSGERLVGQVAKRQAVTNPARTIASVKREMGSDWSVNIDGKKYAPQEISAMILQKLKSDAESYIGETVTEAVITVPAYFSDAQRQATKDAGRIAGLDVKRIINEPTAAALAYGMDKEEPQKIMVYDFGGGTFDVSILDITSDVIEVLATAGNNQLGGDDFDQCVTKYLVDEFKRIEKVDLVKDLTALSRVREAAEKAKVELSSSLTTTVNLPFLTQGKGVPVHMDITITRAKFNEITRHLVDKTIQPVQQAMRDAGLNASQLGKILLVGGTTRIPAVQEAVKKMTGKEPFKGINPDECVAMGACIQGGVLAGTVKSLLLIDVTPLSLGIETVGNAFARIIDRNTALPVKRSQVFSTAGNFQTTVEVNVLQGERELASYNKSLGKFRLVGIKRALRGIPQIEVTFSIDTNGIVNVSAKDLGTNKEQAITISGSSNMTQEQIDQAIRDAQRFEQDDKKDKEKIQVKNEAETLIVHAKKLQKKLDKESKVKLNECIENLKKAIKTDNVTDMKIAIEQVESILRSAGQFVQDDDESADGAGMNDDGTYDATPKA